MTEKMFRWREPKNRIERHVRMTEDFPMSTLLMRAGYRPTYATLVREGWFVTAAKLYPQSVELPLPEVAYEDQAIEIVEEIDGKLDGDPPQEFPK